MGYSPSRWLRTSGRRGLLALLMGVGLFGCTETLGQSPYRIQIPVLQERPTDYEVGGVKYRALRLDDWNALIRELKAACLSLGQSRQECQAE